MRQIRFVTGAFVLALVLGAPSVARADRHGGGGGGPPQPLEARVFKLQHQEAKTVARAIRQLQSGQRDARMDADEELDTISVRDRATNLAVMEAAIKQLDVPRPDVTLQARILIAGPAGTTNVPADMAKVVRQLKGNLQFGAYHQIAAFTQRVRSGARFETEGLLDLAPPVFDKAVRAEYELEVRPVVTVLPKGPHTVQVRDLRFELEIPGEGKAHLRTDVVIPEGETVVVGTAVLGPRALVVVVWANKS
ncbi:MAG TPA: secretin N-terminal domain-containing protein [Polyangia bacterium]